MSLTQNTAQDYGGQRAVFNEISEEYDRFRPGYPSELAQAVAAYAKAGPQSRWLEIGSGTGKGTEIFARQGYFIHCLEPGANLSAVAAAKFRDLPNVTFENATFEAWRLQPAHYEVVFAAQSFHWIPLEMGLRKAADTLKPNGTLALFWNMSPWQEYAASEEIQEIYNREAPQMAGDVKKEPSRWRIERRAEQIQSTRCYRDVTIEQFPWRARYSSADYVALLDTHSSHQMLPPDVRARLYAGILEVLNRHGGEIEKLYIAALYLARKA